MVCSEKDLLRTSRREAARYLPEVSWAILDTILDGGPEEIAAAVKSAAQTIGSSTQWAWLYADLICALNGSDFLPYTAGLLASQLVPPEHEIQSRGSQGKYDDMAAALVQMLSAHAVVVIVKRGHKGDGFSVAADTRHNSQREVVGELARVLRSVADQMETGEGPAKERERH